jgi:hypothetical protein
MAAPYHPTILFHNRLMRHPGRVSEKLGRLSHQVIVKKEWLGDKARPSNPLANEAGVQPRCGTWCCRFALGQESGKRT